jgi:glycosyltransferase involved in cell wall biosynthesis
MSPSGSSSRTKPGGREGRPCAHPRVLFLLACPEDNASSRHRVLAYLPFLTRAGVHCEVAAPLPSWAARLQPFENGTRAQKAVYYGLFLVTRTLAVLNVRRYDVVVVQRDLFPFSLGVLERLLHRCARAVVYDTDDAMHVRPSFGSRSVFQLLRPLNKFNDLMRDATCVVVANEPLREHARRFNPKVCLIPMAVDCGRYARQRARRRSPDGPLTVGWTGTAASFVYLERLRAPLQAVGATVDLRLRIVSGATTPFALGAVPVERVPWNLETEVTDLHDFDIAVLPLDDDEFERSKFPFKLLQYMAAGLAIVASPVGIVPALIEDGVSGLLATTAADWAQAFRRLAGDAELRRRLGAAAQRRAEAAFSTSRYAPVWQELLEQAVVDAARS